MVFFRPTNPTGGILGQEHHTDYTLCTVLLYIISLYKRTGSAESSSGTFMVPLLHNILILLPACPHNVSHSYSSALSHIRRPTLNKTFFIDNLFWGLSQL